MDLVFNHMELTLPKGALTDTLIDEVNAFYGDVFGWQGRRVKRYGGNLLLDCGNDFEQFLLVVDADKHVTSPGMDHLGLKAASRDDVIAMREKCEAWQKKDDRVDIVHFEDHDTGRFIISAFYVKYLLPIYFDVHYQGPREGTA